MANLFDDTIPTKQPKQNLFDSILTVNKDPFAAANLPPSPTAIGQPQPKNIVPDTADPFGLRETLGPVVNSALKPVLNAATDPATVLGFAGSALGPGFGSAGAAAGEGINLLRESIKKGEIPSDIEIMTRLGTAAGLDYFAGKFADFAGGGVEKISKFVTKNVPSHVKDAVKFLGDLPEKIKHNIQFTEAYQDSRIFETLTQIARGSFFKGIGFGRAKQGTKKVLSAMSDMIDNLAGSLSKKMTERDLGKFYLSIREKAFNPAKATQQKLYNSITSEADVAGEIVDITNILGFLTDRPTVQAGLSKESQTVIRELSTGLEKETISTADVPFSIAQKIRSDVIKVANFNKDRNTKRLATELINPLTDTISNGLSKVDPKLASKLHFADRLTSDLEDTYNNNFILKLVELGSNKGNELIANRIFKATEELKLAKAAVLKLEINTAKQKITKQALNKAFENEGFKAVQAAHLTSVFNKTYTENLGYSATQLDNAFFQNTKKKLFKDVYLEGLTDSQRKTIKDIINVFRVKKIVKEVPLLEKTTPFFQISALGTAAATGSAGLAALALTPVALGRILTNESISKFFIKGIKLTPGTKTFAQFTSRLFARLIADEKRRNAKKKTFLDNLPKGKIPVKIPSGLAQTLRRQQ